MSTQKNTDLLFRLCAEIKRAWRHDRDPAAVHRLAADHPDLARDLYEYAALLADVELSELESDEAELAERARVAARADDWLSEEGYALAGCADACAVDADDANANAGEGGRSRPASSRTPGGPNTTEPPAEEAPRPLMALLRDRTGKKPPEIAGAMGVTPAFLSKVNQHADHLPSAWIDEISNRASRTWSEDCDNARRALYSGFYTGRLAASRQGPLSTEPPSPESVLDQGGITDPAERAFWLALASPDQDENP